MVYEYEKENISKIDHFNIVTGSNNVSRPSEELKEVYRKAKAFDNYIAEVKERVRFTENTEEDVENETQKVIDYYMEGE